MNFGITNFIWLICFSYSLISNSEIFYWHVLQVFIYIYNNNNNNQTFYSQASWGRLEMKPHEQKKKGTKQEQKEGENKGR
jgi:hypothetical protein